MASGEDTTEDLKKSKFARDKEKEKKIREAEKAIIDKSKLPKTVEDFNRLVIASPNSSLCWMQFMSFYIDVSCSIT